jgi:hypothetical protein
VLRSIEALGLRINELAGKIQPNITVEPATVNVMPQVDMSPIKAEVQQMLVESRAMFENAIKQSEAGSEDWRAELRMLQSQFATKNVEERKQFEQLFVKTIADIEIHADRIISSLTHEQQEALKTSQPIDAFERLEAKLDAVYSAVTATKVTDVKRDKDGRLKQLIQKVQ